MTPAQRAAVVRLIKTAQFPGFPAERCHACYGTGEVPTRDARLQLTGHVPCVECLAMVEEFVDQIANALESA
jgi:hypothetical protein